MSINVQIVPILKDNYCYIITADNGEVAVIDPGEAARIITFLDANNLSPDYILCTHHHGDHVAGVPEIKSRYDVRVVGPEHEIARIPDMQIVLNELSVFTFGGEDVQILETPGHTTGHICFYFPDSGLLFSGDTLFLMGCGRLFEGTAEQMWESFQKISALPDETKIYCGHEYTVSNGTFGLNIEPKNEDIRARLAHVRMLREKGEPSIPATLAEEKATNVFLRAGSAARFAEIRTLKDHA